jgi:hypothetical protein
MVRSEGGGGGGRGALDGRARGGGGVELRGGGGGLEAVWGGEGGFSEGRLWSRRAAALSTSALERTSSRVKRTARPPVPGCVPAL